MLRILLCGHRKTSNVVTCWQTIGEKWQLVSRNLANFFLAITSLTESQLFDEWAFVKHVQRLGKDMEKLLLNWYLHLLLCVPSAHHWIVWQTWAIWGWCLFILTLFVWFMTSLGKQSSTRASGVQNENWGNRGLFRLNVAYGVVPPKFLFWVPIALCQFVTKLSPQ